MNAYFAKIAVFTESTLCAVLAMLGYNGGTFLRFEPFAILLVNFWTIKENKFKRPFESASNSHGFNVTFRKTYIRLRGRYLQDRIEQPVRKLPKKVESAQAMIHADFRIEYAKNLGLAYFSRSFERPRTRVGKIQNRELKPVRADLLPCESPDRHLL